MCFSMTFLKNQSWNMTCGADLNPYEDRYLGNMILWTPYVSKPFSITWSTVGCFVTYSFILFFLAASKSLLLCGLSLFVLSRGYSLVVVHGLLIVVASPVAEHRLLGAWTSVIMAHRLCCSEACGIFRDWGWNPCPLHWQVDSYPLDHQGSPGFIHSWSLRDSSPPLTFF